MVYKIRNKSFFWTKSGWKNNYHGKVTISERPSNPETTLSIRCRYDHMSFLRAHQSYRNISRHCKQYFYGDKEMEVHNTIIASNLLGCLCSRLEKFLPFALSLRDTH